MSGKTGKIDKSGNKKKGASKTKGAILVLCAHNGDQVLGAGGTLIKYAKEGYELNTIIFSYGEGSHPLQKGELVIRTRVAEAKQCDTHLGGKRILFLGLRDNNLSDRISDEKIKRSVTNLIAEIKPVKIFTHSPDDNHPHHRAVNQFVMDLIKEGKIACDVYTFQVWSLINTKNRNTPKLMVDVSETFKQKINAFKCHKSQKATEISILWNVYLQAFFNGLKNDVKYAELFDKIN